MALVVVVTRVDSGENGAIATDDCWAVRQLEKEDFEKVRMELIQCEDVVAHRRGRTDVELAALRQVERACPGPKKVKDLYDTLLKAPATIPGKELCSWQALSSLSQGAWVAADLAAASYDVLGDLHTATGGQPPGRPHRRGEEACDAKRSWSPCDGFRHDREWVPAVANRTLCKLTRASPAWVTALAGRHVRVLIHVDEALRGLYQGLVCAHGADLEHERHRRFPEEDGGGEVWVASFDGGLIVQCVVGDPRYARTPGFAGVDTGVLAMRSFDFVLTDQDPGVYQALAWRNRYNGPIAHVTRSCADCSAPQADDCYEATGVLPALVAARQLGWPVLDLCALTLPSHAYDARAAKKGRLCSPGPLDQVARLLLHIVAARLARPAVGSAFQPPRG